MAKTIYLLLLASLAAAAAAEGEAGTSVITQRELEDHHGRNLLGYIRKKKKRPCGIHFAYANADASATGRYTYTNTYTDAKTSCYGSSSHSSSSAFSGGRRLRTPLPTIVEGMPADGVHQTSLDSTSYNGNTE